MTPNQAAARPLPHAPGCDCWFCDPPRDDSPRECAGCRGGGYVIVDVNNDAGQSGVEEACEDCGGRGWRD